MWRAAGGQPTVIVLSLPGAHIRALADGHGISVTFFLAIYQMLSTRLRLLQTCCIYLPYGIRHSTSPPPLQGVLAAIPSGQVKLAGGVLARRMCSEGVHLVVHSSCGSNVAGL